MAKIGSWWPPDEFRPGKDANPSHGSGIHIHTIHPIHMHSVTPRAKFRVAYLSTSMFLGDARKAKIGKPSLGPTPGLWSNKVPIWHRAAQGTNIKVYVFTKNNDKFTYGKFILKTYTENFYCCISSLGQNATDGTFLQININTDWIKRFTQLVFFNLHAV